jgi:hypothetical protein
VAASEHGPQSAGIDQFPQEDEVSLHRSCGAGDESSPAATMNEAARREGARD